MLHLISIIGVCSGIGIAIYIFFRFKASSTIYENNECGMGIDRLMGQFPRFMGL